MDRLTPIEHLDLFAEIKGIPKKAVSTLIMRNDFFREKLLSRVKSRKWD